MRGSQEVTANCIDFRSHVSWKWDQFAPTSPKKKETTTFAFVKGVINAFTLVEQKDSGSLLGAFAGQCYAERNTPHYCKVYKPGEAFTWEQRRWFDECLMSVI